VYNEQIEAHEAVFKAGRTALANAEQDEKPWELAEIADNGGQP
jgi:hypothetical protein